MLSVFQLCSLRLTLGCQRQFDHLYGMESSDSQQTKRVELATLHQELSRLAPIRSGVLGRDLTTYSIGGPIQTLCEPEDSQQLQQAVALLADSGAPWRVIGAGSNLLIADAGLQTVVLRLGKGFRSSLVGPGRDGAVMVEVGAAASLMTLSRTVSEQGLSGLEFAAGIPATVGGAVFMNAGAHGGDIASVLHEITVLRGSELQRIAASELPFRYRHSGLEPSAVVVAATFKLQPGDRERIVERRAQCLAERKARQPLTSPSAGSVFKNPAPERPAGRLLEECGLKGAAVGGAVVSALHGNWIINPQRSATAEDVQALMARCVEAVAAHAGVVLQPEVLYWADQVEFQEGAPAPFRK